MRSERRRLWLVIGVAGMVVTTACGSGGGADEVGVSRPDQGASTTGAGGPGREEPTTKAPQPEPEPVYVEGVPQVRATPPRAPAGTRVELEGYGFTGDPWQTADGYLWLSAAGGQDGCYLMAQAEHDLHVTADGHLSGSFVVPAKGACRFSTGVELDTGPLRYRIAFQCTACLIGTFTVILPGESTEEPGGTLCDGPVVFGVQDFAAEIYADGLSCEEAKAFVHDHTGPLLPVTGPAHIDGGGFSCDRTGQSDAALPPRADYRCTGASGTIWFVRQ